ncbi:uncharacterized protein LKV04_016541 [Tautogolabrus adspersus]
MRLDVCVLFLLLICCFCLQRVDCRLPDFTSATPQLQVEVSMKSDSSVRTERFGRLPGLCRRLKRRRVTVLCNQERFCWRGRGHERSSGRSLKARAGQVCLCPRGSRCPRFFIHSL